MKVYLVQHAAAKPKSENSERPLSETGRADIYKVTSFLAGHADMKIDSVFHSGKTRSRETAEALAAALRPAGGVEQSDGLAPLDDPSIWVGRLAESAGNVMLVGHMPHMSKLAALLINGDENKLVVSFQMGGVVCLESDGTAGWAVSWMVVPGLLS